MRLHIHELLMRSDIKPLYKYTKAGIIMLHGHLKNKNLVLEKDIDGLIEYLENILDSDDIDYKNKHITKEVILELKNK